VAIVDDHALLREGTVQLLEQEADLQVVGQAGSGEAALRLIDALHPDVALVDINLPDMSGLELARQVVAHRPGCRVLVVSAYDDYAYVSEAMEVGVGGYLLKTASARELVDAVRAVSDGVVVLDAGVSAHLRRRNRSGPDCPPGAALTARETDVLGLLTRGRSNKEIAAELGLGLRTVESHVSSVLAKLGVSSRTEAVGYALSRRLVPPESHGEARRPGPAHALEPRSKTRKPTG
jgi:DNA-binding NarL/FixJ family response regulator